MLPEGPGYNPSGASVVEDEEPIRRVAKRILEWLGYSGLTTGDGEEALQDYREQATSANRTLKIWARWRTTATRSAESTTTTGFGTSEAMAR